MTSKNTMARHIAFLAVFLVVVVVICEPELGGWIDQNPSSNPIYLEMAVFAAAQNPMGLEYYDAVLDLMKVQTQIVSGINYRLTFSVAQSNCKIGEVEYTKERCTPTTRVPQKLCEAVVFDQPWEKVRKLISKDCVRYIGSFLGNTQSSI